MSEMVESTKKNEAGTLNYEWFLSDDKKICHLYERYKDSSAVLAHLGTFGEKIMGRFMECLEPKKFTVYGNPESNVKEALTAFGPVYMPPSMGFVR